MGKLNIENRHLKKRNTRWAQADGPMNSQLQSDFLASRSANGVDGRVRISLPDAEKDPTILRTSSSEYYPGVGGILPFQKSLKVPLASVAVKGNWPRIGETVF